MGHGERPWRTAMPCMKKANVPGAGQRLTWADVEWHADVNGPWCGHSGGTAGVTELSAAHMRGTGRRTMKRAVGYFIKYPVLADTVLVLFFIFGFFWLKNMRSSFFPEVESRTIQVREGILSHASPQEVEEGVVLHRERDPWRHRRGAHQLREPGEQRGGHRGGDKATTRTMWIDVQNARGPHPHAARGHGAGAHLHRGEHPAGRELRPER